MDIHARKTLRKTRLDGETQPAHDVKYTDNDNDDGIILQLFLLQYCSKENYFAASLVFVFKANDGEADWMGF